MWLNFAFIPPGDDDPQLRQHQKIEKKTTVVVNL
jgi:hypothetical protein